MNNIFTELDNIISDDNVLVSSLNIKLIDPISKILDEFFINTMNLKSIDTEVEKWNKNKTSKYLYYYDSNTSLSKKELQEQRKQYLDFVSLFHDENNKKNFLEQLDNNNQLKYRGILLQIEKVDQDNYKIILIDGPLILLRASEHEPEFLEEIIRRNERLSITELNHNIDDRNPNTLFEFIKKAIINVNISAKSTENEKLFQDFYSNFKNDGVKFSPTPDYDNINDIVKKENENKILKEKQDEERKTKRTDYKKNKRK